MCFGSTCAGHDVIERTVAASKILEENCSTGSGVSSCARDSVVVPQYCMCKCPSLFNTSANLYVQHFVLKLLQFSSAAEQALLLKLTTLRYFLQ